MSFEQWTFFDFVCLLIILTSTGFALTKGLARELISLAALLGGLILAALFYPVIGSRLSEFTRTQAVGDLVGFVTIFLGTLILGAIVAYLVNRFMKAASLQWVDRLLGGLYGFIRGWAVASILVLALIAFPVRPDTIGRSRLAPYLLAGAKAAALVVPQQLKDKFNEEYIKVLQAWNQNRNSQ